MCIRIIYAGSRYWVVCSTSWRASSLGSPIWSFRQWFSWWCYRFCFSSWCRSWWLRRARRLKRFFTTYLYTSTTVLLVILLFEFYYTVYGRIQCTLIAVFMLFFSYFRLGFLPLLTILLDPFTYTRMHASARRNSRSSTCSTRNRATASISAKCSPTSSAAAARRPAEESAARAGNRRARDLEHVLIAAHALTDLTNHFSNHSI